MGSSSKMRDASITVESYDKTSQEQGTGQPGRQCSEGRGGGGSTGVLNNIQAMHLGGTAMDNDWDLALEPKKKIT